MCPLAPKYPQSSLDDSACYRAVMSQLVAAATNPLERVIKMMHTLAMDYKNRREKCKGKKRQVGLTRSLRKGPPPKSLAANQRRRRRRPWSLGVVLPLPSLLGDHGGDSRGAGGGDAGAKLALHPEQGQRKRPAVTGGEASRQ